MNSPTVSYKNHRFPPQIIARAVWLYFRFPYYSRKGISSEPSGHELDHCGLDEGEACG